MAAVFISHSSRDDALCVQMRRWLEKEGCEQVFLDFDKHTGLRAGDNWERQLYQEVNRSHAVLLILTPNWLESKWCFVEFSYARALGKIIFPITCLPLDGARVASEIQGIDLSDWNEEGQDYLRRRLREVVSEVARGFAWDRSRSPYPGLHSFDREDAAIFFGRDPEIRELVERLEARRVQGGRRILLVLGTSGSGKSSLLKAGVLPLLNRDRRSWILVRPFRPGREPLTNFAKALAEPLGTSAGWRQLRDGLSGPDPAKALRDCVQDLQIGEASNATVLVPIDQFEETFTIAAPDEREAFLAILRQVADPAMRSPCLVIGTARSDILTDLLQQDQVGLPFEDYPLKPMPLDRLSKVVEGPASVAALTVEIGLSSRIAQDVRSTDALPLLAFALRELYELHGQDQQLSVAEYESLGDAGAGLTPIENVIRRKADDVIRSVQPTRAQLDALKEAFVSSLVRIRDGGGFVRRPARRAELRPESLALIDALVSARLLGQRVDENDRGQVIVEASHEALFSAWPLLRGWLNDEREFLIGKAQLAVALAEWQATSPAHKGEALLQGLALRRASQWLESHPYGLSDSELKYITASRRRRRQRIWLASGISAAAVAIILALGAPRVYAEYGRRNALSCDLFAAEQENNVNVPGVELDKIVPADAIPACTKALAAQPDNPRLMHNLGRSLERDGRLKEATFWYGKAADLGWGWSQDYLGIAYLYGRGVAPDFAKAVSLLRAASTSGEAGEQATRNYAETDLSAVFKGNRTFAKVLTDALRVQGFLAVSDESGWGSPQEVALQSFKESKHLTDPGITLRVLDQLNVVDEISANWHPANR